LTSVGFTTNRPISVSQINDGLRWRDFYNSSDEHVAVFLISEENLFSRDKMIEIQKEIKTDSVVFVSYSSIAHRIYQLAPEAFTPLGPQTGLLDLKILIDSLR